MRENRPENAERPAVGSSAPRVEVVPTDRVIWQSDTAKSYKCPICKRWVYSQYEGDDRPEIICGPRQHTLRWEAR